MPVHGTGAYYFEHGPTGPVSTEDFAEMLRRMGYDTGLDVEKLMEAGGRAELLTGPRLHSFVAAAQIPDGALSAASGHTGSGDSKATLLALTERGRAELPRGIALPTRAQLSSQVEAALAEAAEAGGHHPIF